MKASLKTPYASASKVQAGDRNHREILRGRLIRRITKGRGGDKELAVTSTESYRTQAEQVQGGALRLTWGSQGRPPPLVLLEQARRGPVWPAAWGRHGREVSKASLVGLWRPAFWGVWRGPPPELSAKPQRGEAGEVAQGT